MAASGDAARLPLDVHALRRSAVDNGQWRDVRVVDETGSTNADVVELARLGEPAGLVLVAEHQTAARGRLGRSWSAPDRSSLSFSMLWRPVAVPVAAWSVLPLLVGVACATALSASTGVEVGLKWPNDLLAAERKLGGILAERVDSADGPAVVVGVGLNVSLGAGELPVPTATSLVLAGAAQPDRGVVLTALLAELAAEYSRWLSGGSGALLDRYRALCVTLSRDVRVELPGDRILEGRAVDVDADGSLVVQTDTGRRVVSAGDVVHVR